MSVLNQVVLIGICAGLGLIALIADWRARHRVRRCCDHDCTTIRRAQQARHRREHP